jgi:hypothetical protein
MSRIRTTITEAAVYITVPLMALGALVVFSAVVGVTAGLTFAVFSWAARVLS